MSTNPLAQLGEQFVTAYYQAFAANKTSVISFYNVYFLILMFSHYILFFMNKIACSFEEQLKLRWISCTYYI